eukprot:TRINITY_DN32161_c0_g1_i1.p1 TRINITY_DN32161_c0_g1~~TRINITY_DN32161_c0_g1_i1.p1  ORF type:complete len:246 (+),score=33.55 TRINITY_DN32161_c0_g1_i1:60-797(+)
MTHVLCFCLFALGSCASVNVQVDSYASFLQNRASRSAAYVTVKSVRHHDTFDDACSACTSAHPAKVCYAGTCSDGSGKYCWSPDTKPDGFNQCEDGAGALISLNQTLIESGNPLNVLGQALESCSKAGTAMTGFMRDGNCRDADDDSGSHHICIKMKSDFCKVTGQPNWCEEKMRCMGKDGDCKIGNWCVCQWAFAGYLAEAGGCDQIVDLVCEATNMAAFKAYEQSSDSSHQAALACIKSKCNV